jgi:beta-lactamase regulating signal transducer with metallopeptidase domain
MTPISMLLKASLLLAVAAIAQALLARRTSAATRHLIWTLAIAGVLLLPVAAAVLPGWTAVRMSPPKAPEAMPIFESAGPASAVPDAPDAEAGTPAAARAGVTRIATTAMAIPWSTALSALYAAGVLLLLVRLGADQVSIERLARRATAVRDPEWTRVLLECAERMNVRRPVRLLRSREQTVPMAFGIWRAAILIPAGADTWSEDRRRAVLLHELAHVARYDCLTQPMAAIACALYWIHPAVWWVARRLRIERELACDDRVLTVGTQAREYAGHLLELAYAMGRDRAPALAVTMARPKQLEGRMLAVLDAARNRTPPALRSRMAGLAIMAALLVPVAAATSTVVPAADDKAPPPATTADRAFDPPAFESAQGARTTPDQERLPGTWEIRPTGQAGMVHLRLTEGDGHYGSTIDVERLAGLSPALLSGAGGPVEFSVRHDAGTFTFEGIVRSGVGAGTYTFTPSATFAAELAKRGFERPTPGDQRQLAREDIGFAFLDELTTQGYARPGLAELLRAAQHGLNFPYLREMGRLGYRLGRVEALVVQRDHGVTPEFVRGLAAQGLTRLSPDDLLQARDHGISPEYISGLNELGYRSLALDRLITLRNHGVSPEFIRELEQAGFRKLSLEALIDVRNHGISPDYVRELRDLGYPLTLDELTKARDHGVSAEYIREMSALGYQRLSLDSLIRLRNHGVDPSYVRELKDLGYAQLGLEDLIDLRNHGVTADRVRSANARAGTRLSVERLKAAADAGWR